MRRKLQALVRGVVGGLVAYALVLNALLAAFAFAPAPAAGAFDPASVICHSNGASPAADHESDRPLRSSGATICEHCLLCSPSVPIVPTGQFIGFLQGTHAALLTAPAAFVRSTRIASLSGSPRAPPAST